MKKYILTSFLCLCLGYIVTSCDDLKFGDNFLEKAPGGDITIDTIFSSKMYADRALNSAYATLRSGLGVDNKIEGGSYDYHQAHSQLNWDNLDALTDLMQTYCTWAGVIGTYYSGTYSAESENALYSSSKFCYNPAQEGTWYGIRKAYLYIGNVDRVPDMTDEEKKVRKAEALMIIATHYSEMFRHLGGVPILRGAIEAGNEAGTDYSRQTLETLLNHILELCDEAALNLPWIVPATEDGRFTKAAALALKCRVLLMAASPIYNANSPYFAMGQPTAANAGKIAAENIDKMVWLGNYSQERWKAVIEACKEFITENERNGEPYKLIQATEQNSDGYRSAWSKTYADRYNGEILIATCRTHQTFGELYHRYFYGPSTDFNGNAGRGYGGGCITLNFVDMFTYTNGEKASYAKWIKDNNYKGTIQKHPFTDRDPRLYEAVMILGDKFQGRVAEMWVGGLERGVDTSPRAYTGFCSRKFLWDYNLATFHDKPANYSYMRLAEVYLIYAEALNETGQKNESFKWLNKIRNRVGLPNMNDALLYKMQEGKNLPNYSECSLIGDSKLREEILDERAREFSFEEVRWFDIIRWKREDIFKKDLFRVVITPTEGTNDNYQSLVFNFSEPELITDRYWKNSFSPKWYLSAFPSDEINKGYGLIQNPGW